jgi:hypothetical protein
MNPEPAGPTAQAERPLAQSPDLTQDTPEPSPRPDASGWPTEADLAEVNVPMAAVVRDHRLAKAAAAGQSVNAYLAHRIQMPLMMLMTPAERAAEAERSRAILREWTGHDPTPEEEAELGARVDQMVADAKRRFAETWGRK